jgi:hypothetical protein
VAVDRGWGTIDESQSKDNLGWLIRVNSDFHLWKYLLSMVLNFERCLEKICISGIRIAVSSVNVPRSICLLYDGEHQTLQFGEGVHIIIDTIDFDNKCALT